jgi:hypothetical protein
MAMITRKLTQYTSRRLTRRAYRALPWIGGVLALATVGGAIKRKGLVRGTLDTALDMTPYLGSAKNLFEVTRGRDLLRDKRLAG